MAALSCTPEGYEKEADPAAGRDFLKVKSISVEEHSTSLLDNKTTGTVTFTWDSKGRIVKEDIVRVSLIVPATYSYTFLYDDASRTCTVKRSDLKNYEIYRFDRKGYLVSTEGYDEEGKPTLGLHRVVKDGRVVSQAITGYDTKKGKWVDIMAYKYEWNPDGDIVKEVPPSVNVVSPDVQLYEKNYTYTEDGKLNRLPFRVSRSMMLVSNHFECPAMIPTHTIRSIAEDGGKNETETYTWVYDSEGNPSEISIYQKNGPENGYYTTIKLNY